MLLENEMKREGQRELVMRRKEKGKVKSRFKFSYEIKIFLFNSHIQTAEEALGRSISRCVSEE